MDSNQLLAAQWFRLAGFAPLQDVANLRKLLANDGPPLTRSEGRVLDAMLLRPESLLNSGSREDISRVYFNCDEYIGWLGGQPLHIIDGHARIGACCIGLFLTDTSIGNPSKLACQVCAVASYAASAPNSEGGVLARALLTSWRPPIDDLELATIPKHCAEAVESAIAGDEETLSRSTADLWKTMLKLNYNTTPTIRAFAQFASFAIDCYYEHLNV